MSNANELRQKKCKPCEGGVQPMDEAGVKNYLDDLSGWELLTREGHLEISKEFVFEDFVGAMDFANNVKDIAETEDHHPDLHVSYGKCRVTLWTHAIGGLSENDFIVAAKIEGIS